MEKFYKDVLPAKGPYFIATPLEKGGFKHKHFFSLKEMDAYARALKSDAVYFAYSSFGKPYITREVKGRTKRQYRTRTNVAASRVFVIDLEADGRKTFQNKREAATSLSEFCSKYSLGRPSYVVDSGGGLHLYWCVRQELDPTTWQETADLFKAVAAHHGGGFSDDLTRTGDIAGVLRAPGSTNWKQDAARPVKILSPRDPATEATIHDHVDLKNSLEAAVEKFKVPLGPQRKSYVKPADEDEFTFFSSPPDYALTDTERSLTALREEFVPDLAAMRRGCGVLRLIEAKHGDVPEPLWYATMGVVGALLDKAQALDYVTEIAAGHPGYDPNSTWVVDKLDQAREAQQGAPTTCAKLSDSCTSNGLDSPCNACPLSSKVNTPFRIKPDLLYVADAVEAAALDPAAPAKDILPAGFLIQGSTLFYVEETPDEETGRVVKNQIPIVNAEFAILRAVSDEEGADLFLEYRLKKPADRERRGTFPAGILARDSDMRRVLLQEGIPVDPDKWEQICMYIRDAAYVAMSMPEIAMRCRQLGWKTDGFLLGSDLYTKSGRRTVELESNIESIGSNFVESGDLATWQQALSLMYSGDPEYLDPYVFVLMCSFGAPLMKFTGMPSLLVNVLGKTGAGKSTALRVAHSVWGKALEDAVTQSDTPKSRMMTVGAYRSLPVTYDEITTIPPEELARLCYEISQGRERASLTSDRKYRPALGGWNNMVLSTSNRSVREILDANRGEVAAQQVRVIEMETKGAILGSSDVTQLHYLLNDNHGIAGPILAEHMVNNRAALRKEVRDLYAQIHGAMPGETRFWAAALSCALVGSKMARDNHIITQDMHMANQSIAQRLQNTLGAHYKENKKTTADNTSDIISSLYARLMPETLNVYTNHTGHSVTVGPFVGGAPTGTLTDMSIKLRLEIDRTRDEVKLYVPVSELTLQCKINDRELGAIKASLKSLGMVPNTAAPIVRLGKDTSVRVPPLRCYEVTLDRGSRLGLYMRDMIKEREKLSV